MVRITLRALGLVLAAGLMSPTLLSAEEPARLQVSSTVTPIHSEYVPAETVEYDAAGSFYHVGPGGYGSHVAPLYPAPVPVPPHVGWTYYTYQPLYPHHYMQPHTLYYTNGNRYTRVRYMHLGGQILRGRNLETGCTHCGGHGH